jgi:hypothetical protein
LAEISWLQRSRPAAIILVSLLLSACGTANETSSTPPATAGSSATNGPAGYRVLFTASTLTASQIFLYDSASSAPQQLVSAGGVPPEARFISSQKIAYIDATNQMASRILTVDLSSRASTTDVTANGYVPAFAYSHDGSMLAYLVHDQQSKASLHQRRGGQDRTYNLNPIPGRGSSRDDEVRLEYSADDKYLLMVDTFVGNQGQAPETGQFLVLRTADLSVAFVPPAGISSNATMATWARHANRLYYRDQIGVRTWNAEEPNVGTLVTGLHWYDPAASPDDRWLAFTDIDTQFVPHVRLYDLQAKQVVDGVPTPRSHPIFITANSIWSLQEQPCQSECLAGPSQTSGKVFLYALDSKRETALPFSDVHTLSQLAVAFSP